MMKSNALGSSVKNIVRQAVTDVFDIERRKKEDSTEYYNFLHAYCGFPKRKGRGHYKNPTSLDGLSVNSKRNIYYALSIFTYIVSLNIIIQPVKSLLRFTLEVLPLIVEQSLKSLDETLYHRHNKRIRHLAIQVVINFFLFVRLFFRCVWAPIQSLRRIFNMKAPKYIKAILCVCSVAVSFFVYLAGGAVLAGIPVFSVLSSQNIIPALKEVGSNLLALAFYYAPSLFHVNLLPSVASQVVLIFRVLSASLNSAKEFFACFSHKHLQNKSIIRTGLAILEKVFDVLLPSEKPLLEDPLTPVQPVTTAAAPMRTAPIGLASQPRRDTSVTFFSLPKSGSGVEAAPQNSSVLSASS